MTERGISERYDEATRSFIDFARTLSSDDWAVPERDVLSRVSGTPDGAATEPRTASQMGRNAAFTVDELLERWEGQDELLGAAVDGWFTFDPSEMTIEE